MGKFLTWVFTIAFLAALAYGGWGLYHQMVPSSTKIDTGPLQTVKLAKGSIASTVNATGNLRSNQSAQLSWDAAGKVGSVKVKIGDKVTAGDVLANLDPTSLPDNILQSQVDIVTANQALSDLLNTQSTLPAAEKAVIDAQTAIDKAKSHRDMMGYPTRGNPQQIASSEAAYLRAAQQVDRARTFYERLPGDFKDNKSKAEGLVLLEKAKIGRDLALSTLNWYKGGWKADEIAMADNTLVVAKAQLVDAKMALAKVQKGPDPNKIAADQQRIDVDQAVIDTQNLVAPIDGVITVLNNKPGDLVSAGDISLRLDDVTAFFVDLHMSEVDIARIRLGQATTIVFDAIPSKTYSGAVTAVAPVGATTNSVVDFTVTLKVSDPDAALRPGITAATSIVVDTAQNVWVVPAKAVKTVGAQKVVYVLSSLPAGTTPAPGAVTTQLASAGSINPPVTGEAETVIPVVIKEGLASDTAVEIVSTRLKVGDLIVLNPPASALSGG